MAARTEPFGSRDRLGTHRGEVWEMGAPYCTPTKQWVHGGDESCPFATVSNILRVFVANDHRVCSLRSFGTVPPVLPAMYHADREADDSSQDHDATGNDEWHLVWTRTIVYRPWKSTRRNISLYLSILSGWIKIIYDSHCSICRGGEGLTPPPLWYISTPKFSLTSTGLVKKTLLPPLV